MLIVFITRRKVDTEACSVCVCVCVCMYVCMSVAALSGIYCSGSKWQQGFSNSPIITIVITGHGTFCMHTPFQIYLCQRSAIFQTAFTYCL